MDELSAVDAVRPAIEALTDGRMVIVIDADDRENEGDLVLAAEFATAEQVAFVVRHTTGILCAPMSAARVEQLRLPQMVAENTDSHETAFTVTVDHVASGTGVSAESRAITFRALADPHTQPDELRRPGHVFPLQARAGGTLVRPGHTEAAVDLLTLAGREQVGLIGEIVDDSGAMLRGEALRIFAARHELPMITIADLIRYRLSTEVHVQKVATSTLPTVFGEFRAIAFRSTLDGLEHLALTMGDVVASGSSKSGALVRVHSECLTGDILASLRCDCGHQLEQALQAVAAEGNGAVIYLRGHEGRGIGLGNKIRAYALQDDGLDTVDANTAQGLPIDARNFDAAAQILTVMGVERVRLITNNPVKSLSLSDRGLTVVEQLVLPTAENPHNRRYLRTKRDRMGHSVSAAI
ncbi:bifunctional 3,4-dihydroxy-2-butanone 4-phosphate synthase/GTP cyclohydrolase II [Rhodococcus erythropolis]|nr:bifunctional 3,4-dihydroxy-2-butanone 4-phosphate synthase/GTP cyclohydrolase II [Rhodococcus erythropolis]